MDDLAFIRARIGGYADYPDEEARHLVDKQVRAWVGEALSRLRERLGPTVGGELAERMERVMLLCEFTNQQFMHAIDHAHLSGEDVDHLHVVDRALLEAAERAEETGLAGLDDLLESIEDLFAKRARAVAAMA